MALSKSGDIVQYQGRLSEDAILQKRDNEFLQSRNKGGKKHSKNLSMSEYSSRASLRRSTLRLDCSSRSPPLSQRLAFIDATSQENSMTDSKSVMKLPQMQGMKLKIFRKDAQRQSENDLRKGYTFPPLISKKNGSVVMGFMSERQGRRKSHAGGGYESIRGNEHTKELLKNALHTLKKFQKELDLAELDNKGESTRELKQPPNENPKLYSISDKPPKAENSSRKVVYIRAMKRKRRRKITLVKTELESIVEVDRENTLMSDKPDPRLVRYESPVDECQADEPDQGEDALYLEEDFKSLTLDNADTLAYDSVGTPPAVELLPSHAPYRRQKDDARRVLVLPRLDTKPVALADFGMTGKDKLKQHIKFFAQRRQKLHLPRLPLKQYG